MTVPPLPSPRRRSRRWVWFFAVLAVLAAAAVVIPIVYNLRLQLTPEQLAAARQRWDEHGTPDYDILYQKRTTTANEQEPAMEEIAIEVRGGKVMRCVIDGEVQMPTRDFSEHTVEGMFARIDARMKKDAERTDRRNYATASVDRGDGHITHYVHRVAGSREREEWTVRLTRK